MADEAQKLSRNPVISSVNAHMTSFICISTPLLPHPLLNPSQHKHAFFPSTWVSRLVQLPSLTERAWDGTVHYIYTLAITAALSGQKRRSGPRGLFPLLVGSCPDKHSRGRLLQP